MKSALQSLTQITTTKVCLAGCLLLTTLTHADSDQRTLDDKVARLTRENMNLKRSLTASSIREEQSALALSQAKLKLGALGRSIFNETDDKRLLSALEEIEYLYKHNEGMERVTLELIDLYRDVLAKEFSMDPVDRASAEATIRKAEAALGYRNRPATVKSVGTLQNAKVVSIDSETGLLVLNVGSSQQAKVGMRFTLMRGSEEIAKAIIAEVRTNVSGLLVESLTKKLELQLGDRASVLSR